VIKVVSARWAPLCITCDPEFIFSEVPILDDPTSGQDKSNSDGLLGYPYGLSRKGVTLLFTTHDIEAAIRWSDKAFDNESREDKRSIEQGFIQGPTDRGYWN